MAISKQNFASLIKDKIFPFRISFISYSCIILITNQFLIRFFFLFPAFLSSRFLFVFFSIDGLLLSKDLQRRFTVSYFQSIGPGLYPRSASSDEFPSTSWTPMNASYIYIYRLILLKIILTLILFGSVGTGKWSAIVGMNMQAILCGEERE